jgi:hypothetical protein
MQEKVTRIKSKVGITSVGVISTKVKPKTKIRYSLIEEEDMRLQMKHLNIYY